MGWVAGNVHLAEKNAPEEPLEGSLPTEGAEAGSPENRIRDYAFKQSVKCEEGLERARGRCVL